MKIYTKTGDDGTTGLLGNARVRKDAARIEAYGDVDELNAALGVVLAHLPPSTHAARDWLEAVQNDLFVVGAILATPPKETRPCAVLPARSVEFLEQLIDQMDKTLPPLKHFILPQGTPCASFLHLGRAICRRAERRVVQLADQEKVEQPLLAYLNRLSDFLFVLARWVNQKERGKETAWLNPMGGAGQGPGPDRLAASLHKLGAEKERRKTLFEKASTDIQKKKEEAEKSFQDRVEQIKKEGGKVDPTIRPIDLD